MLLQNVLKVVHFLRQNGEINISVNSFIHGSEQNLLLQNRGINTEKISLQSNEDINKAENLGQVSPEVEQFIAIMTENPVLHQLYVNKNKLCSIFCIVI